MDKIRHAHAFLPNQQNIFSGKARFIVQNVPARGQKHKPAGLDKAKRIPVIMTGQLSDITIIQAGAAQLPVVKGKSARLDDVDWHTQASG
jgi:hypothetical protein